MEYVLKRTEKELSFTEQFKLNMPYKIIIDIFKNGELILSSRYLEDEEFLNCLTFIAPKEIVIEASKEFKGVELDFVDWDKLES